MPAVDVPLPVNVTVTLSLDTTDKVAVSVRLDPFSATEEALVPSVTVGVLSSSTMLIVTELGDPLLAEAPDKELIEITADLLPPEALSLVGLNTAVPVVFPALIVISESDA